MKLLEILIEQWNEGRESSTALDPYLPRHLIFGEFVYRKAIADACSAICFNCRDGVEIAEADPNYHQFRMADGRLAMRELCKASGVRQMLQKLEN